MPEFLTLLPPDEARELLLGQLSDRALATEEVETVSCLGRVTAEDLLAPHALPEFDRSSVDGYAVRARETFGAGDAQPSYLKLAGEVPMGDEPGFRLKTGECALIHTGGMLPADADAVVMLEHSQPSRPDEIEVRRAVSEGENVIRRGEDVISGQLIVPQGRLLRPAEIGGLMALGILRVRVSRIVRVGLIASGDEVVPPDETPRPGQIRDVNSYSLATLVLRSGGEVKIYGIAPDRFDALKASVGRALNECEVVVVTAGSSASTRDMTARVIDSLGPPGVLVHGVQTRPGKPTILGVCQGKAVIGLPGNPVSALVNGCLFVLPVLERLSGAAPRPRPSVPARLTVNLASQAGREDWWPVRLVQIQAQPGAGPTSSARFDAEPIFGKSNLIFNLAAADGLLRIPPDATGLSAGALVEVMLL